MQANDEMSDLLSIAHMQGFAKGKADGRRDGIRLGLEAAAVATAMHAETVRNDQAALLILDKIARVIRAIDPALLPTTPTPRTETKHDR